MNLDPKNHPRCVRNERVIRAPIEHAWSVLTDFARYPEWNPFTHRVTTNGRIGDPVKLDVNLGKTRITMNERLTRYDAGRAVAWGVKWGGGLLLDCDRVQELTRIDSDTTLYRCHEAFDGMLAPIVYRFYRAPVQLGFDAAADALVRRCEATHPA